jgi:hypothetical protein
VPTQRYHIVMTCICRHKARVLPSNNRSLGFNAVITLSHIHVEGQTQLLSLLFSSSRISAKSPSYRLVFLASRLAHLHSSSLWRRLVRLLLSTPLCPMMILEHLTPRLCLRIFISLLRSHLIVNPCRAPQLIPQLHPYLTKSQIFR